MLQKFFLGQTNIYFYIERMLTQATGYRQLAIGNVQLANCLCTEQLSALTAGAV